MARLLEFVTSVQQAVLFYSVISLKPALRDSILRTHMVPSTAATMMTTSAAMAAKKALHLDKYTKDPSTCRHPSGVRGYGAAGVRVRICDLCGQRWVLDQKNNMILATPKASPSAETPLNLSKETLDSLRAAAKAKKQGVPAVPLPRGPPPAPPVPVRSQGYSQPSSTPWPASAPTRTRTPAASSERPKPMQARPKPKSLPQRLGLGSLTRGRQWHGTASTASNVSEERMSVDPENGRRRTLGIYGTRPTSTTWRARNRTSSSTRTTTSRTWTPTARSFKCASRFS